MIRNYNSWKILFSFDITMKMFSYCLLIIRFKVQLTHMCCPLVSVRDKTNQSIYSAGVVEGHVQDPSDENVQSKITHSSKFELKFECQNYKTLPQNKRPVFFFCFFFLSSILGNHLHLILNKKQICLWSALSTLCHVYRP